ncbi:MAG: hypothetical protein ACFE68_08250 [Candidatus Hodarchaeota archaeon]
MEKKGKKLINSKDRWVRPALEISIILAFVWATMIFMFLVIEEFLVPITEDSFPRSEIFLRSIVQVGISGGLAAGWLYFWHLLTRIYVQKAGKIPGKPQ